MATLSIIIPVLNEAYGIADALSELAPLRARGAEVVVVDGGSTDATVELARPLADQVIAATRGRGAQMNAGAAAARGDVFLFLHADTILPPDADRLVLRAMHRAPWGRFDVKIAGRNKLLLVVAAFMNLRSRLTGIATGDQTIFVARSAFASAGGFPDIALMEDVTISRRLKRFGRPQCISRRVTTSGRRWARLGLFHTVLLMWQLRLAYYLGGNPDELARRYGYTPRDD